MNRRELLLTGATTALVSSASAAIASSAATSSVPEPVPGPRMNFEQADKVMTALGLKAMVLGTGLNFQYATGSRPVLSRMGQPPSAFAIVKRSETKRMAVVAAAFSYYYTLADVQASAKFPVYLYTAPDEEAASRGNAAASPLRVYADRGEAPVNPQERQRARAAKAAVTGRGTYADPGLALAAAIRDLGLSKARVAVDDPYVDRLLSESLPELVRVSADDCLRRIRPVKSATEIVLMRQAAAGNAAAALEATDTIRAGGSYRDLRAAFFGAAGRRGHRGVFMAVDRVTDDLYDDAFRDGQSLMIDCVSEYEGYHGDYGRTVFVGEPVAPMKAATNAIGLAWDALREQLRPGLRFSDIRAMGQRQMRSAGKRYAVPFGPHSVGLYHTDHVGQLGLPTEDLVLEPGMIISVDCPLAEAGVGGSAHLEDLMLITRDGAEPLNPLGQKTIVV